LPGTEGFAGIETLVLALPEEILFRSLIQDLLTLLAASFIFGCAHRDNGPQALPNWRYMILAILAGAAYGKVFEKASTALSSAGLHMCVWQLYLAHFGSLIWPTPLVWA
jgi:uncharacterized protein